jgi:hypothetical protein
METRAYEVKIVKGKRDPKHDITKPHTATQTDKSRPAGEYFLLELLAKKVNIDGISSRPQKRRISLTIFNSPDQCVVFNDIQNALSDAKNYTVTESGLEIHPTEMGIRGVMVSRKTSGVYKVIDNSTGKPMIITSGPHKDEEATRSEIRFFCHEEEDPDVRFAQELARIPKDAWITANANDDEVEGEK